MVSHGLSVMSLDVSLIRMMMRYCFIDMVYPLGWPFMVSARWDLDLGHCELNFGARPFRYPIQGFLTTPPSTNLLVMQLFQCLSRLLDVQGAEWAESLLIDNHLYHGDSHPSISSIFLQILSKIYTPL